MLDTLFMKVDQIKEHKTEQDEEEQTHIKGIVGACNKVDCEHDEEGMKDCVEFSHLF